MTGKQTNHTMRTLKKNDNKIEKISVIEKF